MTVSIRAAKVPSYEEVLGELAQADPRIMVLTAENRAPIRNLPGRLGPRFCDVGICEQTMVGMAAGLALRGRVPVVHALATFLTLRAFEFIRTDVGIAGLPVKLVGTVPGFLSEANGPTHQALEDVAIMRGIPGMQVVCPADEEELAHLLPAVLASPHPTYLRHVATPARVAHGTRHQLGVAEQLTPGDDVTLLSYGFLVGETAAAAELLRQDGIGARVINLRSLVPLDQAAILAAARETPLLCTVEDHFAVGGLYSIVAELLTSHPMAGRRARVHRMALEGRWFRPALLADVLEIEGFTATHVAARVRRALAAMGPAAAAAAPGSASDPAAALSAARGRGEQVVIERIA
jgi:transketolase